MAQTEHTAQLMGHPVRLFLEKEANRAEVAVPHINIIHSCSLSTVDVSVPGENV